jgi:hypothetical protein
VCVCARIHVLVCLYLCELYTRVYALVACCCPVSLLHVSVSMRVRARVRVVYCIALNCTECQVATCAYYIYIYIYTHTRMYVYLSIYLSIYIYIYTRKQNTYIKDYTYISVQTHTYIHMLACMFHIGGHAQVKCTHLGLLRKTFDDILSIADLHVRSHVFLVQNHAIGCFNLSPRTCSVRERVYACMNMYTHMRVYALVYVCYQQTRARR